jgi:hypothetical protein
MMQNGIKFFASECHISKILARQKAILSLRVHDSERGNLSYICHSREGGNPVLFFSGRWINSNMAALTPLFFF